MKTDVWYTFNPLYKPMFSPAIPNTGFGDCVMLANTPFTTVKQYCNELYDPICEYNVDIIDPPTLTTTTSGK